MYQNISNAPKVAFFKSSKLLVSFNGQVDASSRPCLSGVPFWENLQVKRHAFSVRFSHPLSSSHFRQCFSSSSTSHYTIDVLFFFQFSSTLFLMLTIINNKEKGYQNWNSQKYLHLLVRSEMNNRVQRKHFFRHHATFLFKSFWWRAIEQCSNTSTSCKHPQACLGTFQCSTRFQ